MADLGSEVKKEVNAGIATVSRMMERLETRDNSRTSGASVSNSSDNASVAELDERKPESVGENSLGDTNKQASCASGSSSS